MAKNDFYAILNVSVTFKDINLKLSMVYQSIYSGKRGFGLSFVSLRSASLYLVLLNAPLVKDADNSRHLYYFCQILPILFFIIIIIILATI